MKPPVSLLAPEEGRKIIRNLIQKHGEALGCLCLPNDLPPPEPAVEVDIRKALASMERARGEGLDYRIDVDAYLAPPEAWIVIRLDWSGVQRLTLPFRVSSNRNFLTLLARTRRLWLWPKGGKNGEKVRATVIEEVPVDTLNLVLAMTALFPVEVMG